MSKEYFINLDKEFKERFTMAKFMEFNVDNYDPLTSHMLNSLKELPVKGKITVNGMDFRPDVISYQVYGDTQYWWVIMLYNSFMDVDQIKHGMDIVYPNISDLEDLYFTLKIKQGNNE